MSVYVHKAPWHDRLGRAYHLMADTSDELEKAAQKIGLDPAWIQKADTPHEHFAVMGKYIATLDTIADEDVREGERQLTILSTRVGVVEVLWNSMFDEIAELRAQKQV